MKVTTHVPTQSFGFIEFEGTEQDLPAMEALYNQYAERPVAFRNQLGAPVVSVEDPGELVTTFTGEQVRYWPKEHKYLTLEGNKMLSGSKFAERFEEPFDRERLLGLTAKKRGSTVDKIGAAWDMRGLVSRNFGTAIHQAMELWFKHRDVEYGVMKHPFLKSMVETFPLKDEDIKSEVMVSDVKRLLVGQIDGLQITGEMRGRVLDFKSDAEVSKNLERHSFQLSFYASILEAFGWTIEGLDIWNYTTAWKRYELERKEVKI